MIGSFLCKECHHQKMPKKTLFKKRSLYLAFQTVKNAFVIKVSKSQKN